MSEFGTNENVGTPSGPSGVSGNAFGFGDLSDAPTVDEAMPPALTAGIYKLELKDVSDGEKSKSGREVINFRFGEVETNRGVFFAIYGTTSDEGADLPGKGCDHPAVRARIKAVLGALQLPLNLGGYSSKTEMVEAFKTAVGRVITAKLKVAKSEGYSDRNEIQDASKG